MIVIKTSMGDITCRLDEDTVKITTDNILKYVDENFYEGLVVHRVIDGFMIQMGGLSADMSNKSGHDPIENEADKGGKNTRGTLAMARTNDPHSASSQFFINTKDNDFLNHKSKDMAGWGYCVFGEVVDGMDVVDAITKVKTGNVAGHGDVPLEPITIQSIERA